MENTVAKIKEKVKRFFHSTKGKIITVLSLIFGGWFLYHKGWKDAHDVDEITNYWWDNFRETRTCFHKLDGKTVNFGFFEDATDEIVELKDTIKALTKEVNENEV